jgi:hypothetical protein
MFLFSAAACAVIVTVGAAVAVYRVERSAVPVYEDSGGAETVLLDQKNGERRDRWVFSLLKLTDIGTAVSGELGYGELISRSARGTFFRGSFSFAQYGRFPSGITISAIRFFDGTGAEYRPLRAAFCGQSPGSDDSMPVALFPPKTPCAVELLFDAAPGIGPYSARVTYKEKVLR